jgi:hypothetical protein
MRLLDKNTVTIPESAEGILKDRAELFVRSGLSLTDFESLTDKEIMAVVAARDAVELERIQALAVMLSPAGKVALDAIENGESPEVKLALEMAMEAEA